MKHHEILTAVHSVTGLHAMTENSGVSVLVTGDQPEMVPVIRQRLIAAGYRFTEKGGRKFLGRKFIIELRNVGDAFNAEWVFA